MDNSLQRPARLRHAAHLLLQRWRHGRRRQLGDRLPLHRSPLQRDAVHYRNRAAHQPHHRPIVPAAHLLPGLDVAPGLRFLA